MQGLAQNLRYALRQLRKNPGFTAVCVLTLALGIGANTAVFTVMNAVMLRYLPVANPQQLVYLQTTGWPSGASQTGMGEYSFNEPSYRELRAQRKIFSDLMAFVPLSSSKTTARFGDKPETLEADMVSGNFFSGIGVQPARGRLFNPEDETQHSRVAVLSYGFWTRRFARDPAVLGQTFSIKGSAFTIVGVASSTFAGVELRAATDLWIPLQSGVAFTPWGNARRNGQSLYDSPSWWSLMLIGRLAPGVTIEKAAAGLNPVFAHSAYAGIGEPKAGEKPPQLILASARGMEGLKSQYQKPIVMLSVMVGLVLIIACTNVAMLFVARNTARAREFGIRIALGAGRGRLFGQLLLESLIIVFCGAATGWLFALWSTAALSTWSQMGVQLSPDWTVLAFTFGISLLAGLIFGLAPLIGVAKTQVATVLKSSSATSNQSREKVRSTRAVLSLQMALCFVLLIGAGVLLRTILNLENHNLGFRSSGLLVFGIELPKTQYKTDDQSIQTLERITRSIQALPGVESVTLMQNRIGSGWSNNTGAYVDGRRAGKESNDMRWNGVGPEYLRVLGVPLLLGREFTASDSRTAPNVVIVNQEFVRLYLSDTIPIGHQLGFGEGDPQFRIVGVAQNSSYTQVREKPLPMAYFPYTQLPGIAGMHFEVRLKGAPAGVLDQIRSAVQAIDTDLALLKPMTQKAQFDESFSDERMFARLSMFFGLLAAFLVAIGLYGSLAYRVNRRTVEIGVRMAIGARREEVLWMILREGFVLAAVGSAIGIPLALLGSHFLRSMLFGVQPGDPLTFAAAACGVAAVTLIASLIPARRAARVQPIQALRMD